MSRDFDPETDQMPGGDTIDQPNDVERPSENGTSDPIPVPPTDPQPAPIDEPVDAPNTPSEPNPNPIGDPTSREPKQYV